MTADWNYFNHNLCNELTRLRPKLSFAHGYGDYGYFVYANPRKHEVIPISENEEEFEDTSDQITWEEFLEKHSDLNQFRENNPDLEEWKEAEYMIGKTPSEALWNNCSDDDDVDDDDSTDDEAGQEGDDEDDLDKDDANTVLKDLEDLKKLVKKRGSFGACFLPDAFGPIVCFMNHCWNDGNMTSCIFASEAWSKKIVKNLKKPQGTSKHQSTSTNSSSMRKITSICVTVISVLRSSARPASGRRA